MSGDDAATVDDHGLDGLTMDGRIVHIRPVRAEDRDALRDLHVRASPRSRYLRFFSAGAALEPEVRRLTRTADPDHLALLVEDSGQVICVASYERLDDRSTAEFAVLVDDARQGEGIGTLVLEHLTAAARRAGITALVGYVLADNATMLRVSTGLGPGVTRRTGGDPRTVRVRVPTLPDEAALAAVDERDRIAEHRSLRPLLAPAAIAVIGSGEDDGELAHNVLATLLAGGYPGMLHPVSVPSFARPELPGYPSVGSIGAPVDLAVIAVPPGRLASTVDDCVSAGVRAALVLSAGSAPELPDLVRFARSHGLRLVGPDSVGVLNTDPAVRLTAMRAPFAPLPGGLAVAAQSGAVGVAILNAAVRAGAGISTFVSLGSKADVSGNDLLAYWYDDPATRAVALYLESIGNPRRFASVTRALARRKPVLIVRSGQLASASPGSEVAVESLLTQAGVIRTDSVRELLDTARVLVDQPLPRGERLAVLGNAGGLNTLAVDTAKAVGLSVPPLSDAVVTAIGPAGRRAQADGSVDLGDEGTPADFAAAIGAIAASGEVDALVVTLADTRLTDLAGALQAVADAADAAPDLPVAAVVVSTADVPVSLGRRRMPVFALPDEPVRAFGRAAAYATWRRQPLGERPELSGVDSRKARDLVDRLLIGGRVGWQPYETTRTLLDCYVVAMAETLLASDIGESVEAAGRLGYPVVVKAAVPGLVHKNDIGAVRLDLDGPEAVRRAYIDISAALGVHTPDVLVQRMVPVGVELTAEVTHDQRFGSVLTLGLGGAYADLLGDRSSRLLPLMTVDPGGMWRSLTAAALLTGHRAGAATDTDALEDLLSRIGRLAEDLPEVAELRLDPIIAGTHGVTAVDVQVRLSTVEGEPDPYVRSLRAVP